MVYGEGSEAVSLYISNYDFTKILSSSASRNILLDLEFEGKDVSKKALVKDVQTDPVTSRILSVDFLMISMDKEIAMSVPITLVGTPEGVKNMGGILEFLHREVEISCLPGDIPDKIELDVSDLKIGDTLHYEDIVADKFTVLSNPKVSIATIVAPTVIKERAEVEAAEGEEVPEGEAVEAEAAAAEEKQEPEVIKEKKEEK